MRFPAALRSSKGVGGPKWAARATQSTGAVAATAGGGCTDQCSAEAGPDPVEMGGEAALHPPASSSVLAQTANGNNDWAEEDRTENIA